MSNVQLENQTSEVTFPRNAIEDFLISTISQLNKIETDTDATRRSESIMNLIHSCEDSLTLLRQTEDPAITQRISNIEDRVKRGDLPKAYTADDIDAKFAAYLAE